MSWLSDLIRKQNIGALVLQMLSGDPFFLLRTKITKAVLDRAAQEGVALSSEAATLAVNETCNEIKRTVLGG